MGTFNVFVMYFNSVHLFSTLRVKYFVTVATSGVITHLLENCVERKSERSSLAFTYDKISVSFKFCKLSNDDNYLKLRLDLKLRTFTPFVFPVTRYPIF